MLGGFGERFSKCSTYIVLVRGPRKPLMSIEEADVVDFISVGLCGDVELAISDHLDWEDGDRHIELLQKKIYRYLDFIESGELYQSNPAAAGKHVAIRVRAKFSPVHRAIEFFDFIRGVVEARGVTLVSGESWVQPQ
jgi:hypothetical protein